MATNVFTKFSTMYSTNPKMDRSGITAKEPRSEMVLTKNGIKEVNLDPRVVTGGMLYKKGLMKQENFRKDVAITRPEVLSEAAKMVNQGTPPKYAMDLMEEKVEAKTTYNTCSYWDK
jgi:hypothetical protein